MKLKQIPEELLDPWFDKFEKLTFMPAIPRHSRKWSYGFFGQESIGIGFGKYGYCQVIPMSNDELYLFFIYIDPPFRGKGCGKAGMKKIIEIARELKYKRMKLDVGYLNPEDKIPAPVLRKFYATLGFKREKGTKMVLEIH
jgi:GNAT superfamily N-acetyltransferase